MGSAGKWILGLMLLVAGALLVARTVSDDPGSQAEVKNLPSASPVASSKDNAKKAAAPATDVACKKACIEVTEVANDSITTAKLAPGSVTLSKLAFEVPNLNELENEINARKAAEASVKAAQAEAAAAGAKNDAAITAAAANGITAEAAARTAADQDISAKFAAGDADLLSKLNKEIADRTAGDDTLQKGLNIEIAARQSEINNLRGELGNATQIATPIIKINNNEIVDSAVRGGTGGVVEDGTITAADLANDAVIGGAGGDIKDDTVAAVDLANDAVVGRASPLDPLMNVKLRSLRGERLSNAATTLSPGDLAVGTLTGEAAPLAGSAVGNIALGTIDTGNLANGAVTGIKIGGFTIEAGNLIGVDKANNLVGETRAVTATALADGAVTDRALGSGLDATKITTGTLNGALVGAGISGTNVTTGTVAAARVADLDAAKIISGTLGSDRIPNLSANKITTDTLGTDRIPTLDAGKITTGTFAAGRIPTITGGTNNDADPAIATTPTGLLGVRTVSAGNLAQGAVTSYGILDGTITSIDLAGTYGPGPGFAQTIVGAVTGEKIADATIESRDLADGAVTFLKLHSAVQGRITALETLPGRITNLGVAVAGPTDTDRVDVTRITGLTDRQTVGGWFQNAVPASQAATQIPLIGGGRSFVIPVRGGSITGISISSTAAASAGSLTAEVTLGNGTGTGLTAVLNTTFPNLATSTQATGLDPFTAGQFIGVKITTDATWAPLTGDITVFVETTL